MRTQVCYAFRGFRPHNDVLSAPTREEIDKWTVPIELERFGAQTVPTMTRFIFVDKELKIFTPCAFDKSSGQMSFVNLMTEKRYFPIVDDDWFDAEQQVRVLVPFDLE